MSSLDILGLSKDANSFISKNNHKKAIDIYKNSIKVLINKFKLLKEQFNTNQNIFLLNEENFFKIRLDNEDHTIGYLLETYILQYLVEDYSDDIENVASFYIKPNPNEDYIEYSLKIPKGKVLTYFNNSIDKIIKFIESNLII